MIEIKHLSKSFGDHYILKDINCTINDGDIIAVIGPSGCGKSTFVRCINCLEKPSGGEILFDGKDVLKGEISMVDVRKYAGMIFQSFNLYPHYTVLENIMVPQIDILKVSKQEAYDRAVKNLKMVGLVHSANKYPNQLSGGQKQRVAIARTLAMDNNVILMDEPTSSLDPVTVREVQYVIRKLAKAGKTMVIVTHDMRFAEKNCNRVFFLTDGVIYEEGSPSEIFNDSKKEETIKFINCIFEKTFELLPENFDFASVLEEICAFCDRNDLSKKVSYKIESVFEELISMHLIPHLENDTLVKIKLSYSEKTESVSIECTYNEDFDPLEEIDSISRSILDHNTKIIKCEKSSSDNTSQFIINIDVN